VTGSLKGFDLLVNLVIDDTQEFVRDLDTMQLTNQTRELGLVVCRGPVVTLISPLDGSKEIENPFLHHGDDE